MATAGSVVLTEDEATLFDGVCTGFSVYNSDASDDALIHVDGLHDDDEWFAVAFGTKHEFIVEEMGITLVKGKMAAGGTTALVYFGITILSERR